MMCVVGVGWPTPAQRTRRIQQDRQTADIVRLVPGMDDLNAAPV